MTNNLGHIIPVCLKVKHILLPDGQMGFQADVHELSSRDYEAAMICDITGVLRSCNRNLFLIFGEHDWKQVRKGWLNLY